MKNLLPLLFFVLCYVAAISMMEFLQWGIVSLLTIWGLVLIVTLLIAVEFVMTVKKLISKWDGLIFHTIGCFLTVITTVIMFGDIGTPEFFLILLLIVRYLLQVDVIRK